ncbi:hypothetical protein TRFO_08618 [Tritrichomonas foetus]|uniref:Leucine Rich Repeat family protein n=1 Tax=Tritrichomonas foetus TaxID=1144522 RepID=A0A1J4JIS9_9EUKA|nr:hypothetical protein TRFO_08618 [Tritrichomonas foetus]|eukprot:OHS99054.1 hypothetical protein TRFO_08618 [Tritrichomonas foetus]
MSAKSDWPKKALQCLKTSSRVDLEGEHIDDLSRLGSLNLMRQLNLSYVQISTLSGLKPQPNLETFIADGSQIANFMNFSSITNIRRLSLINTPVSRDPHFLLSALIACPNLTSVNGKMIPSSVRQRAQNYPEVGRLLINAGWMAEAQIPTDDEFTSLCDKYQVDFGHSENNQNEEEEDDVDHFEEILASFYQKHDKLVLFMKRRCGFLPQEEEEEEEEEEEDFRNELEISSNGSETKLNDFDLDDDQQPPLVERLAEVLRENGIEFDQNDIHSSILNVVQELCNETEQQKISSIMEESDSKSEGQT